MRPVHKQPGIGQNITTKSSIQSSSTTTSTGTIRPSTRSTVSTAFATSNSNTHNVTMNGTTSSGRIGTGSTIPRAGGPVLKSGYSVHNNNNNNNNNNNFLSSTSSSSQHSSSVHHNTRGTMSLTNHHNTSLSGQRNGHNMSQNGQNCENFVKNSQNFRKTMSQMAPQKNDTLTTMIETDFEGLLERTLNELHGKQQPKGAPSYNLSEFVQIYSKLPTKVGPDSSGSIRRQRELEVELYNNQYNIATKAWNHYQKAEQAIVKMKDEIHHFLFNQRTLQEQLLQHQKKSHESITKLNVLIEETKKSELSLIKIKTHSDQLQSDVLKVEEDQYQQHQRYDIEKGRLEQMVVLMQQTEILNSQKESQITSLVSESTTLQLRLDDVTSQLNDLRTNNDVDELQKREIELKDIKARLEASLSKHQRQLDQIEMSIQTKELHQQSLLKAIGPETRNELLQLQSDAVALQQEIDQYVRITEGNNEKIKNFESLIPQRQEELELLKLDLSHLVEQYQELLDIVKEKKDTIKQDEATINNLEGQISAMKNKKHQEELMLKELFENFLKNNKGERERIEESMSTMKSINQTRLDEYNLKNEKDIMDNTLKNELLLNDIDAKEQSLSLLQNELTMAHNEVTSLQSRVDHYVELNAMSGPQLEIRITQLLKQQGHRRMKIRQLKEQYATYDDENLLLRREKLNKIRASNDEIANQIVQLGGAPMLQRITKPEMIPTYDQLLMTDFPKEFSGDLDSFEGSSHLRDTIIYEEGDDDYGRSDDDRNDELSAPCIGDGDDSNGHDHNNSNPNDGHHHINETQSLLSLRNTNTSSNNNINRMTNINPNGTRSVGTARQTNRLSALPTPSSSYSSSASTNNPSKPAGTRPLARTVNSNTNTSSTSANGAGSNGLMNKLPTSTTPAITKISTTVTRAPVTNKISKSARMDNELPSYMRSTAASRQK